MRSGASATCWGRAQDREQDFEEQAEAIAHDVAEMLANRLEPYVPPAGLSLDEPSEHG